MPQITHFYGIKFLAWKSGSEKMDNYHVWKHPQQHLWTIVMSENIHNNTYGQLSCVKTSTTALMDNYHDWKHPQQHLWTIIMSENIHNNTYGQLLCLKRNLK